MKTSASKIALDLFTTKIRFYGAFSEPFGRRLCCQGAKNKTKYFTAAQKSHSLTKKNLCAVARLMTRVLSEKHNKISKNST